MRKLLVVFTMLIGSVVIGQDGITPNKKDNQMSPTASWVMNEIIGLQIDEANITLGLGFELTFTNDVADSRGYFKGYKRVRNLISDGSLRNIVEVMWVDVNDKVLSFSSTTEAKSKKSMSIYHEISKWYFTKRFGTGDADNNNVNNHEWYGNLNGEIVKASVFFYKTNYKYGSQFSIHRSDLN